MFRCPFGRNQPKISRCQIACSRCKLPTVQQLGDQQHQKDPRSQKLPSTLRLGFLGQYGLIFLECGAEAHTCPWVQQVIAQFSKETGYTISQGILSLQQVWPARRRRWWCILAHPSLGVIPWQEFPQVHPQPMVSSLLGQF